MFDAISYGRQIALIFAFHCNHCHSAPPGTAAGGLDTSSYRGLRNGGGMGRVIVPGDPAGSLLMEFLDGRRAKRMPLSAPPLAQTDVDLIARWIAEGAREDPTPARELTATIRPRPGAPFTVICRVESRAYLRLTVTGRSGELLHREEIAMHEAGEARWPLTAGPRWPRQVTARVEVMFHSGAAALRIE